MIDPTRLIKGYPNAETIGNTHGRPDRVGVHFDRISQNVAEAVFYGYLVSTKALDVIYEAEESVRREHALGQCVHGCTVLNPPVDAYNTQAERLRLARANHELTFEAPGFANACFADALGSRISLRSRVAHFEPNGMPGEFNAMAIGDYVSEHVLGFDPDVSPILLILADRLIPVH